MARDAATTPESLIAPTSSTLLLDEDDGDCLGVVLVEDEYGTEFQFSDDEPDAISHSGMADFINEMGGHCGRVDRDFSDGFTHAPFSVSEFAYLPPPPGVEDLIYLEYPQPVFDLRSRGLTTTAQSPGLASSNSINFEQFLDNHDVSMTHNDELVTWHDETMTCRDVTDTRPGIW